MTRPRAPDLAADDPLRRPLRGEGGFCSRRFYRTLGRYPGRGRLVGEPLGVRELGGSPRNLTVSPNAHRAFD